MSSTTSFNDLRRSPGTVLLAVTAVAVLVGSAVLGVMQRRTGDGTVTIDGRMTVSVEIMDTPATREKGLSGRDGLGPDEGMLFLFPAADRYAFWMKDMRFPIDILWINGNELIDITTDVPLPPPNEEIPRYYPQFPADKVLEVQAGYAKKHGLKPGMEVRVNVDKK